MDEFGEGAGGGIGQTNRDAIRKNDFGGRIGRVNDSDRNEGRCFCFGRRSILLPVFLEPTMKTVNGATDFSCDLCDGGLGIENAIDGVLPNFGGVVIAGHEAKGGREENAEIILSSGDYARMRFLEQLQV